MSNKLPPTSPEIRKYFSQIRRDVKNIYEIANQARKKGFDPSLETEIPLTPDVAARVEGLVGPIGVANRIRELERDPTMEKWEIAFKIAEEIIQKRKFKPFENIKDLKNRLLRFGDSITKAEQCITTQSNFFTIRITANSGVAKASTIAAIIKYGEKVKRIAIIAE